MRYVYSLPDVPSFAGKGLTGYTFGPLNQDLEVHYIDVSKGHDTFQISKRIARTYYVLSGTGYFTIDNIRYDIAPGMLIEVPAKVEYSYSGSMRLIAYSAPRWFRGNDMTTKLNPDVLGAGAPMAATRSSLAGRLVRLRVFGKSPMNAFLRLNQRLWNVLPARATAFGPVRRYGELLHRLAVVQNVRAQAVATFFCRNRPELDLIARLVDRKGKGEAVNIAVLGCSTGAEVYSIAWRIKSRRPDLKVKLHGVDISREAVESAIRATYSRSVSELTQTAVLERMTGDEVEQVFDRVGETMVVKPWVREGTDWRVGDVAEKELVETLGLQDIVVANNFLCHMDPPAAERCLRNIGRLVKADGYLFVSGVDLDVRMKVATDSGWKPVREVLEDIHDGDPTLRRRWPCDYTGLEPLNTGRPDWTMRYASAFQVSGAASTSARGAKDEALTQ